MDVLICILIAIGVAHHHWVSTMTSQSPPVQRRIRRTISAAILQHASWDHICGIIPGAGACSMACREIPSRHARRVYDQRVRHSPIAMKTLYLHVCRSVDRDAASETYCLSLRLAVQFIEQWCCKWVGCNVLSLFSHCLKRSGVLSSSAVTAPGWRISRRGAVKIRFDQLLHHWVGLS